ncbi:MAG TPA: signal recognition particle-docking protein FtsY [Firmicutes bacterium]|nr:signal recognition particle-docking protein FtsY [Bacillota bacterium]
MLKIFKEGLRRTREAIQGRFDQLFRKHEIDGDFFEELEEILISADLGVETTGKVINLLQQRLREEKVKEAVRAREILKELLISLMDGQKEKGLTFAPAPPTVFLVLGVNGVGKTTTIAKLAYQYGNEGKNILIAAGDTFRAAAIEQLEEWSNRVGVGVIKHHSGGDPSAVIYDAVNAAVARKTDLLLCDTAGRLHTKSNLLEEIKKIHRVISRAYPGAPHETLLVIDATTGQNGIAQAKFFQQAVPLTGIALTKIDGTARGGIVIAVKDITGIPVKLVGMGEKKEDLQRFDAHLFVEALLG